MTMPFPRPYATVVPEYAIFLRSASKTSVSRGLTIFRTGTDSPVSDASSILRLIASIKRTSAGTLLPISRRTISPGTNSLEGILISMPFRKTNASGAAICFNASIAFSARYSCTNPKIALTKTIAKIAIDSKISPPKKIEETNEITTAATRIKTRNDLN